MASLRDRDSSEAVIVSGLKELQADLRKANPEMGKRLQQVNKALVDDVAREAKREFYSRVADVTSLSLRDGPVRSRPSGKGSVSRSRESIRASASGREARIIAGGARAPGFFGHEFGGSRALGGADRIVTSEIGRGAAAGNRMNRRKIRSRTRQFPEHRGREGYVLYPIVRRRRDRAFEDWNNLFDDVFDTKVEIE